MTTDKYQHRARQYYGCAIIPAAQNASGIRYSSLCFGVNLRADTLDGIKHLIRANYPLRTRK
jgi:hypothetical protein